MGGVHSAEGSRLQLLYNGEVLPAGRALSSFGIPHGAVLDLVSCHSKKFSDMLHCSKLAEDR